MAKEEFEKMWSELEKLIIYQEKALNNGIFNSGRYYDFYQKKEAVSAEKLVMENAADYISKTTIIEIEYERRTLYRLTIIFNKD
jgi:hypothetical protein